MQGAGIVAAFADVFTNGGTLASAATQRRQLAFKIGAGLLSNANSYLQKLAGD